MKTCFLVVLVLATSICGAQNKYRALIIGVSNYSQLPKESQLQYADDDAVEFYHFIMSKAAGNFDSSNVKLLLNEKATAGQIYGALDWLIDVTRENDKVIIYFSGHGDIETKTVKQRGFLLAHDSPRAGYQVGGTVKISDLQDYMETLVTQNKARVTLVTDACRSGKLAGGEAGATQTTAALQEQWASVIKILSSQAGELSGESLEWGAGHGVFTFNLIKALSGMADTDKDGFVSLLELNMYLSTEVPKATGDTQHPVVSGNLSTKVSKADETLIAAIVAKEGPGKPNPSTLLASNKGSVGVTDSVSRILYKQFLNAIDNNRLIAAKPPSAVTYYRELERLNPNNTAFINDVRRVVVAHLEDDAQKVLNRYMQQDQSLDDDNYSFARQELDSALSIIPKNHSRYNSLASKKLFLDADILGCTCHKNDISKKQAATSLISLKKAVAIDPDAAYLFNSMGSAYFYLRNYDSAIISYSKSIELAPTWTYAVNNLGTAYKAKKQTDKALEMYTKAIEITPKDPKAYNFIGNLYEGDKMMEWYKKGFEIDPDYFASLIAAEYFFVDKYPEALNYFDMSIERAADKRKAALYAGIELYQWVSVLPKKQRKDQALLGAIKYFDKTIELAPDSIGYLYDFGMAFQSLSNPLAVDATIKYFTKFVKAVRGSTYYFDHDMLASFEWLHGHDPEEVVTAAWDPGNTPASLLDRDVRHAYEILETWYKKKKDIKRADYYRACAEGSIGDGGAVATLGKAITAGFRNFDEIDSEIGLDPVRDMPEFDSLMTLNFAGELKKLNEENKKRILFDGIYYSDKVNDQWFCVHLFPDGTVTTIVISPLGKTKYDYLKTSSTYKFRLGSIGFTCNGIDYVGQINGKDLRLKWANQFDQGKGVRNYTFVKY